MPQQEASTFRIYMFCMSLILPCLVAMPMVARDTIVSH